MHVKSIPALLTVPYLLFFAVARPRAIANNVKQHTNSIIICLSANNHQGAAVVPAHSCLCLSCCVCTPLVFLLFTCRLVVNLSRELIVLNFLLRKTISVGMAQAPPLPALTPLQYQDLVRIKSEIQMEPCWPVGQCRRNCDHCVLKKVSAFIVSTTSAGLGWLPNRTVRIIYIPALEILICARTSREDAIVILLSRAVFIGASVLPYRLLYFTVELYRLSHYSCAYSNSNSEL